MKILRILRKLKKTEEILKKSLVLFIKFDRNFGKNFKNLQFLVTDLAKNFEKFLILDIKFYENL